MSDFVYLVDHHLSDMLKTTKGKKQITAFINELLQSKDKFKAGATTLEVIHNPQKYISNTYHNTLSNLELEDLIAYADDAGDFRFDIKWEAKTNQNVAGRREVNIFVDTKNYSSANSMFKDLGQFKAYIRNINSFDQLYIIQQGGRGVTREQIIIQLKRAIVKDANNVYNTNPKLFHSVKVNNQDIIKNFDDFKAFIKSDYFDNLIVNSILTTK